MKYNVYIVQTDAKWCIDLILAIKFLRWNEIKAHN